MSIDKRPIYIPVAGPALLESALLNKGSAFSAEERQSFNLEGLIPPVIESIEEQAARAYRQYQTFKTALNKHIYLRNIQDTNETLFYRLVQDHISEMLPMIYTPTVGEACQQFSSIYRRARGLFISYEDRERIDELLNNAIRHNVRVIVVTDGERILGLGDQGIGGMGIPIGKLSLYTACGGISPAYTLPVVLDVGTNNPELLNDPMYMGARHPRISGDDYLAFVDQFMEAVRVRWPDAMIQFEDFAKQNAVPLLERYQHQYRCFNDDVQGTAAVTVGTLLAACKARSVALRDQQIVFLGAGSAGCGIAEAIIAQMVAEGISDSEARRRVFVLNSKGLMVEDTPNLYDFQQRLAQPRLAVASWDNRGPGISLFDVVHNARPTVLIGVSAVPGLFTEEVIREMHSHCPTPIVLPLSNPTSKIEATPDQVLNWTNGEAIVATGSPFPPVTVNGKSHHISQCNNVYIFPGVGLGVLACGASRITDDMLLAASRALADCSPLARDGSGPLLPPFETTHEVSRTIALAVAKAAIRQGLAISVADEVLTDAIERMFWQPSYRRYKRTAI
ncbi:MAG: NAD-dependent malic enzyme [Gammaproteobacteria bacterium]|nr:NAD-dependent malic enzyme [Gammaproteobacteria bacterium]